ncbi:MAG: Ig-like domain-containing protein [Patescibacteria group bacterium]
MFNVRTIGRKALTTGVIVASVAGSFVSPAVSLAAGCQSGTLIKGSLHSVYYCGADGKRYVFTGEKSYRTWYASFDNITTISDSDLGSISIGGNVTYRPGVKMVKIDTDPKVYAVGHGGTLRWVTTEAIASCLYGAQWNTKIDDIADAFFVNYKTGAAITNCGDFNTANEMNGALTINQDKDLQPAADTTAPIVISVDPANGSTTVARNATISATFSEAMSVGTINASNVTLKSAGNVSVSGVVTYSGNKAYFNPDATLAANTTYSAEIKAGVKDVVGNAMVSSYGWSFTTTQ